MNYPRNFQNIYFIVEDLSKSILSNINDYEKNIHDNFKLKHNFYNIDFVYMHSVLLDIGKLLCVTGSDKSGLNELEKLAPNQFKKEINDFKLKYSDIISKITTNRNKIIAHIDISENGSYFKLGFSHTEIDRKIEDFKKYVESINNGVLNKSDLEVIDGYNKLKSSSIKYERYSPSDFYKDKDIFVEMVNIIRKIAQELNYHFYKEN